MSDFTTVDTGAGVDALRRVDIIDDLLGAVLLLAAAAFAVALELTRRQVCAVYQLAFGLCASWAFFIVGGLVDHHVSDDQLGRALYRSYLAPLHYTHLPIAASVLVSLALVWQLSSCDRCECCCAAVAVGASPPKASSHKQCFEGKVWSQVPMYIGSTVLLFVAIGARLNVRLRESAIHPIGGTVHWTLLCSPCYLSVIHTSAVVLIALKVFLQHADKRPLDGGNYSQRLTQLDSLRLGTSKTSASTSGVLAHAAPSTKTASQSRRSAESKQALTRSPRSSTSSVSSSSTAAAVASASIKNKSKLAHPEASRRTTSRKGGSTNGSQPFHDLENQHGDVSSLISSDSENDDDVLQPNFKTITSNTLLPPLHQQQQQPKHPPVGMKSHTSSRKLGHTSGFPPSPGSITSSSSASSALSLSSMASSAAAAARQAARTTRHRTSSNRSTTSTMNFLHSDSDDLVAFERHRSEPSDYYRARTSSSESASSSFASHGLRRRGAAQILTVHHASSPAHSTTSEWLECFDAVSGSVYYYNQRTGESRWEP